MGGFAARKALIVVANVERVLAIELLAACQAMEFLRPLKTNPFLESVYDCGVFSCFLFKVAVFTVRQAGVKPLDQDRVFSTDIEMVAELLRTGQIYRSVLNSFREHSVETSFEKLEE